MHCGIKVMKTMITRNLLLRSARSSRTWRAVSSGKSGLYLALANDFASSKASRNLSNLIATTMVMRKS